MQTYMVKCSSQETAQKVITGIIYDIQQLRFPGCNNEFLHEHAQQLSILYIKKDGYDTKYYVTVPKFRACTFFVRHGYVIIQDCADAVRDTEHINEICTYLAQRAQLEPNSVNSFSSFDLQFNYTADAERDLLLHKIEYNQAQIGIDRIYEDTSCAVIDVTY